MIRKHLRQYWLNISALDRRSLALFRVMLGALLLCDLAVRATELVAHYTDLGLLPRQALLEHGWNQWYLSFHMMTGNPFFVSILFIIAALLAFGLMIGYHTRLCTILSWVFLVSLQIRNPLILQGGDVFLRLILFFGMFLPLADRFSVDAVLGKVKTVVDPSYRSPATFGYILQIASVYFFAALLKTGIEWRDGHAVYYTLMGDHFVKPLGKWMLNFPELMKFLTHSTMVLEQYGPFLLFMPFLFGPLRMLATLSFMGLHVGFFLTMEIAFFPFIAMVAWLAIIPGWAWDLGLEKKKAFSKAYASMREKAVSLREWIGNHAENFYYVNGPAFLSWKPLHKSINIAMVGIIAVLLWWNVGTIDKTKVMPYWLKRPVWALRLDQKWSMFAPFPYKDDGWFVIPAKMSDGTERDLFRDKAIDTSGRSPASAFEKPELISAEYGNGRWRKYMRNIWLKKYKKYRLYYGKYLCRKWNYLEDNPNRLKTFKIVYMKEKTLPNFQEPEVKKVTIWNHDCFKKKK